MQTSGRFYMGEDSSLNLNITKCARKDYFVSAVTKCFSGHLILKDI